MEEKREKKKVNVGQILMCILLVICLIQNAGLKSEIQALRNNTSNRISEIHSAIGDISYNISNTLEQEASLISFSEYTIDGVDIDAGTVDLHCELLPKEYTENVTEVLLVYENEEYPMDFEGGSYKGIIPISIFADAHIKSAIMRDGETIRTEALDWYISPRYDYLPMVYADMGNSYNSHTKDGKFIWTYNGDLNISMDIKGEYVQPEKAYFYVYLDDEEIERVDLSENLHENIHYSFKREYEIPFGSTLTMYAEVIDSYGLHHRSILEHIIINGSGVQEYDEGEVYWRGSAASIYDGNGNLLYSEYPEREL